MGVAVVVLLLLLSASETRGAAAEGRDAGGTFNFEPTCRLYGSMPGLHDIRLASDTP